MLLGLGRTSKCNCQDTTLMWPSPLPKSPCHSLFCSAIAGGGFPPALQNAPSFPSNPEIILFADFPLGFKREFLEQATTVCPSSLLFQKGSVANICIYVLSWCLHCSQLHSQGQNSEILVSAAAFSYLQTKPLEKGGRAELWEVSLSPPSWAR